MDMGREREKKSKDFLIVLYIQIMEQLNRKQNLACVLNTHYKPAAAGKPSRTLLPGRTSGYFFFFLMHIGSLLYIMYYKILSHYSC